MKQSMRSVLCYSGFDPMADKARLQGSQVPYKTVFA